MPNTVKQPSSVRPRIYFSDVFDVSPDDLEEFGAFDVSLINDLPLFIDPFLLFNSDNPEYRQLHEEIVRYVGFLRDKAVAGQVDEGLLEAWFTFREVKQNWLGYSLSGNQGRGLGHDFATTLHRNLLGPLKGFGTENVTTGSHLEKVCLIDDGIGRDNVSDLTTNLIKDYLLRFTQRFAREYLRSDQRQTVRVRKAAFNYRTETWEDRNYDLPVHAGDYVILTPVDLLTRDETWINRDDLNRQYPLIVASIPNKQLVAQLNNYFQSRLSEIVDRDAKAKEQQEKRRAESARRRRRRRSEREPSENQRAQAASSTINNYPVLIDFYIKLKEEHGDDAHAEAELKVRTTERLLVGEVRNLTKLLGNKTAFYQSNGNTHAEAVERVKFLKDVIENKGGWRIFYANGIPVRKETDIQIMFRLTWGGTVSDVNREVDNGRGPSDFEISRGRFDKSLVEFKLASNSGLKRNLQKQAEIYQKASDAQTALKVIVFFTEQEEEHVHSILRALKISKHPNVFLIDARSDNKPSGSKA